MENFQSLRSTSIFITYSIDSSDLEPTISEFYMPNKLFEDEQVTSYTDFRMDIREDQLEPELRPTYIQEILSGKRRLISMS